MFSRLISTIREDQNPHLHRVSFLLLWIASYGLAWYVIYIYEMLWYETRLDGILSWLKYSAPKQALDGLVVGLLFGLMLSSVQTWIIRLRYGYVPRLWRSATIIGATIAGLGYPRVGWAPLEGIVVPTDHNLVINNFSFWFGILALFQTFVMFSVHRKSWLIVLISLIAGAVATVPLLSTNNLYARPMWSLIMGTAIQALGTGLLILYLMANPRMGVVPKREKVDIQTSLDTRSFVLWWVGIFYLGLALITVLNELWQLLVYYSPTVLYENLELSTLDDKWYLGILIFGIIGFITATAQMWLMQKYANVTIPRWRIFTVLGWMVAGVMWRTYYYSSVYPSLIERDILMAAYIAIPALIQTIPMSRAVRGGWIWGFTGIIAGLLMILIRHLDILSPLTTYYSLVFAGLALSLSTCYIFYRLHVRKNNPAIEANILS